MRRTAKVPAELDIVRQFYRPLTPIVGEPDAAIAVQEHVLMTRLSPAEVRIDRVQLPAVDSHFSEFTRGALWRSARLTSPLRLLGPLTIRGGHGSRDGW